jgi:hypothetical protein
MRRIVLGQFYVLFHCIGVLILIFCYLFACVCMYGPCVAVTIVNRRRATGAVPGAAIFRAVRAAAGRVRGRQV